MALSFSVFNKFKAIDDVTAPIRKMTRSVGRFGKKTVAAFRKSDRQASKFSKTVKGIFVGGALLAGVALLQQGIGAVTNSFVQFDDAIFAAGARFKDIGPDVENFTESIRDIQKAARDAGATTEFTATQAAQALDFLARAGFSSVESIGALNSMINLATASGEDFARVADISSDLLGAFGLNSDDAAKKIANLNRLNDVLIGTVNSANVTVEDMFETMKQVGPVATGILGASLEEVAALTAVLGSSGIKGSEAMTALKNAYLRLAAPTSEARKLIDALNISMSDASGKPRKMTDIMEELGEKISGIGEIQQAQVLDVLFGKRAIAGAKNLQDNIKNIRLFEKRLLSLSGIAQRTSDIMRMSLGNRIKALISSLNEFGFKILDNFKVKGKDAITGLTESIRGLSVQPIVDSIKSLLVAFEKIKKIVKPIGNAIDALFLGKLKALNEFTDGDLIPTITILTATIIALKVASIAFGIVLGVIAALNPFGLFAIGVAAAIVAVRALGRHHDRMQAAFAKGMKKMTDLVLKFGKIISDIGSEIGEILLKFGGGIGDFLSGIGGNVGRRIVNAFSSEENQIPEQLPISPQAGLINTIRQETNNRSTVDVNLNNLPQGTRVEQTGNPNGFTLNTGFSGAQ